MLGAVRVESSYLDPGSIVLSIRGCDCCQLISTVDAVLAALPGRSKADMLLFFFSKILAFILTPSFTALRVRARWAIRHYWVSTSDWIEICRVIDQSADIIEWNCRCHRAAAAGGCVCICQCCFIAYRETTGCCVLMLSARRQQHSWIPSVPSTYVIAPYLRRRQQHCIDFNP